MNPHSAQIATGFPICLASCSLSLIIWENPCLQNLQWKGYSPEWSLWWSFKADFDRYLRPQWHIKNCWCSSETKEEIGGCVILFSYPRANFQNLSVNNRHMASKCMSQWWYQIFSNHIYLWLLGWVWC